MFHLVTMYSLDWYDFSERNHAPGVIQIMSLSLSWQHPRTIGAGTSCLQYCWPTLAQHRADNGMCVIELRMCPDCDRRNGWIPCATKVSLRENPWVLCWWMYTSKPAGKHTPDQEQVEKQNTWLLIKSVRCAPSCPREHYHAEKHDSAARFTPGESRQPQE